MQFFDTEMEEHAQYAASRWICMTIGQTQLAIIIDIDYDSQSPKITILDVDRNEFLSMNDKLVKEKCQPIQPDVVYGIDDQGQFVQGSETSTEAFDHYGAYILRAKDSKMIRITTRRR
ncbi:hypothetical protein OBBRIDRAFT_827441 [Obba rivulosa]|uniref:Uncharacterized protein n=1 Tax=Obba rivulosa TaxID=1052685 RepID=A0A8E2ANC0_9APHY|nr:hypothetical protein OBBRIDRAFT_827441 [Obba rivulosa]